MTNPEEKNLTCTDAFGKMCMKVKWTARHLKHGNLRLEADFEVVEGVIKQCDIAKLEPHERFRANHEH
jgi:hypothetical protein